MKLLVALLGLALALAGCSPCWQICHEAMRHLHLRRASCDMVTPPPTSYVQPPRCACTFSTTLTGPTETVHVREPLCPAPPDWTPPAPSPDDNE